MTPRPPPAAASSVLTLTVYTQPGLFASVTSLKVPFLQKTAAKALGKVGARASPLPSKQS
jgi:hypothetical protein